MHREAWRATVHGVAERWTQLSDFHSLTQNPSRIFVLDINKTILKFI